MKGREKEGKREREIYCAPSSSKTIPGIHLHYNPVAFFSSAVFELDHCNNYIA